MKSYTTKLTAIAVLCICAFFILGCTTGSLVSQNIATFNSNVAALQNNPVVQDIETVAGDIGLTLATGSPAFDGVVPLAVSGLTYAANNTNPQTAVTGTNMVADSALIISTIKAVAPNSTGAAVATKVANAYTSAMTQLQGVTTATPQQQANAVLAAISVGMSNGAVKAAASN